MLRLKNLSNKYQKRLIRPLYAHTQATPYAATLDSQDLAGSSTGEKSFKTGDGARRLPKSGDTSPLYTRTADAHTTKNSLTSGVVMVRTLGESVAVATGINDGSVERPFGLLANFVGGDLDDLGDEDQVGVWRGSGGAVFEILAPAFNDLGLQTQYDASATKKGAPVKLYAGRDGRLCQGVTAQTGGLAAAANAANIAVAHLIERVSSSRIIVDLLV